MATEFTGPRQNFFQVRRPSTLLNGVLHYAHGSHQYFVRNIFQHANSENPTMPPQPPIILHSCYHKIQSITEIVTMPITTTNLAQQFSSLATADTHDKVEHPPVVSPTKCELNASVFSHSDDEGSQGSADGITMLARKTEHKLLEEQGMLNDEPLLKSNPYRFVLFPIQENDVRNFHEFLRH